MALLTGAAALYTPDKRGAALRRRYAQPPSSFVEALGVRLHIRDTGPEAGPALILLHGFASSLHTWEAWAEALSGRWRVVRIDLPGFGLTGADPGGDYSDGRTMAVLLALMERLGIGRAGLVGNSMGGRIAWQFAARHPERVDRLVLISPDGFSNPGRGYGERATIPPMFHVLRYVLPASVLRQYLAPSYADPRRLTEAVLRRYRDMLLAPGVRSAMMRHMRQMVLEDPTPVLARVRAPTLVVWGEQDRIIPPAKAADFARGLPDARVVMLPGLGHAPQEEAPARSLGPVLAFLDGTGRGESGGRTVAAGDGGGYLPRNPTSGG